MAVKGVGESKAQVIYNALHGEPQRSDSGHDSSERSEL
jgi:hypothetical protein